MNSNSHSSNRGSSVADLDTTADILRHLIAVCKDGEHGFKTAADDTKDPELKSTLHSYSQQRTTFIRELETRLASLGCDDSEHGSISGSLHRGWINLRAALTSHEKHAVLAECERGEDSAVAAYREALEKLDDTASRELVSRQFAAVYAAHNAVRTLRDASAPAAKK